jgi:hypothetical protein
MPTIDQQNDGTEIATPPDSQVASDAEQAAPEPQPATEQPATETPATQPPAAPAAPSNTWDEIAGSDEFKKLPNVDKLTVLTGYSQDVGNHLLSLPGANPDEINARLQDFTHTKINEIYPITQESDEPIAAALKSSGATVVQSILGGLKGVLRMAPQPEIPTKDAYGNDTVGGSFIKSVDETVKNWGDFLNTWREEVPAGVGVKPGVATSIGRFAGGLAPYFLALPAAIITHVGEAYGDTFDKTQSGPRAVGAAAFAGVTDLLFMKLGEFTSSVGGGIENGLGRWATKLSAGTAGNISASQLIKAGQAALEAPPSERVTAFKSALVDLDMKDAGIQAAFAALATYHAEAARTEKITAAHQEYQSDTDKADTMSQAGLSQSAAQQQELARQKFEASISTLDAHAEEAAKVASTSEGGPKAQPVALADQGIEVLGPEHPTRAEGEHIVSTAIADETGDKAQVGPAWNTSHAEITGHAVENGIIPMEPSQYGFIAQDAEGNRRFVGRDEGGRIAIAADQTKETNSKNFQSQYLLPDSISNGPASAPSQPIVPLPSPETVRRASEFLRNFADSPADAAEKFSSLDIKTRGVVQSHVLRLIGTEPKILDSIVRSIPVNVMDNFARSKPAAQKLFHDPAMFAHELSVRPAHDVPAALSEHILKQTAALHRTEISNPNVARLFSKPAAALSALDIDRLSSGISSSTPPISSSHELLEATTKTINQGEENGNSKTRQSNNSIETKTNGANADNAEKGQRNDGQQGRLPSLNGETPTVENVAPAASEAAAVSRKGSPAVDEAAGAPLKQPSEPPPVPESTVAHERATAEALGSKENPGIADEVSQRYAVANKILNERKAGAGAREHVYDLLRQDLLNNQKETGDPFKVKTSAGETVDYSASKRLGTKLQDYLDLHENAKRAEMPIHASGEEPVPAYDAEDITPTKGGTPSVEETRASNELSPAERVQRAEAAAKEGEHPHAVTVRAAIARHFAAFARDPEVSLAAAPGATKDQVTRAARIVYDQILRKSTGKELGIGKKASAAGKPGPVQKLIADPAFRAAVEDKIADRVRQDIRASIPKDRTPVAATSDHKNAFAIMGVENTDEHAQAIEHASEQIKAGVSMEQVIDALPDEIKARTRETQERFNTNGGAKAVLQSIVDNAPNTQEGRFQQILAKAMIERSGDVRVVVDPTLINRKGATGTFDPVTNEIRVSPNKSENKLRFTLLHEQGHEILETKAQAYKAGRYDLLELGDVAMFKDLDALRQKVLNHESVSPELRDAANASNYAQKSALFKQALDKNSSNYEHYGLLDLSEFVTEIMTNPKFQKFLDGIPNEGAARGSETFNQSSVWGRVKQMLRTIILGDRPVGNGSILAHAFDQTIDLVASGRLEDQMAARFGFAGEERAQPAPPFDAAKYETERKQRFMEDFAAEHGFKTADDMAAVDPALYNEGTRLHAVDTNVDFSQPGLRFAAADEATKTDATKRTELLFGKLDKLGVDKKAEDVAQEALEKGVTDAPGFAKAFEAAGFKPATAEAAGNAMEAHLQLATFEKANENAATAAKATDNRAADAAKPIPDTASEDGKTPTSLKNSVVDQERIDRGLPPAMQAARKSDPETWDRAMTIVNNEPGRGQDIVNELLSKPRPLSDDENMVLLHRQISLRNEYDNATAEINDAAKAGDPLALETARAKMAGVADALVDVYNAGKAAGTENARGLRIRQMLANEDYSLEAMRSREQASRGGDPLSDKQKAEIQALHQKLFDANTKLLDAQAKADEERSTKQGEDEVDDIAKRVKKGDNKPPTPKEELSLDQQRTKILKGMQKALAKKGEASDMQPWIKKLAENYVRRGLTKLQPLSRSVWETVKTVMPDITERQVRDLISGYGDFKQLNQDAIKAKLRDLSGLMQQAGKIGDMISGQAPKKTGVERRNPSDHERELIKLVNEVKKEGGFSVTDPAKQLKTSLDAVKTRLKNQIKDMTRQIETGIRPEGAKGIEYDQEAETLKALRDRVQETLDDIVTNPDVTDEERVKIATKSLLKSIEEYNRRLETDDYSRRDGKAPVSTPEIEALRAQRDALRAEYKTFEALEHPERRQEALLKGYIARLARQSADLQQRLAENNFAPKPSKSSMVHNDATLKVRADYERLKNAYDMRLAKNRLANRTTTEKTMDFLASYGRAVKLTAISTLGKLTAAAAHRMVTTPIEEGIGAGIGKIPGVSKVFEKADIEGGFNSAAEARALTQYWTQGMKDLWDTLKTGDSDLTAAFGKKHNIPYSVLDWFGQLHAALKAPTKRAAFERALFKLNDAAIRSGVVDPTDPAVKTTIEARAYVQADRAIFMQDNRVVQAYRAAIARLEQPDKTTGLVPLGGKIAATVAKVLLPIVKVPSNYVAEAFVHAFGTVTGSVKLAQAFAKGIENLHPDEANAIARHLKKGSLGAAVLLLGFFNSAPGVVQGGGYYQAGEKRKPGDLAAGELRVFGYSVPKFIAHTPLIEVFMMGRTIRRVADSYVSAHDREKRGITSGLWAGGMGLAEETPFLDTIFASKKIVESPEDYFGNLARGIIVPGAVGNIASWTDQHNGETVKRKARTFLQQIELGIPGLRQQVPIKKKP